MKLLDHDCARELKLKYPGEAQAKDGEHWTCSCGRKWEHVCDETEGSAWVPFIRHLRDTGRHSKVGA